MAFIAAPHESGGQNTQADLIREGELKARVEEADYPGIQMSTITRTLSRGRIEDLYSTKSPSRRMGMDAKPIETRITDSVHISDAASRKYQEWKEEKSAASIPQKHLPSTEGQDVKESLSAVEVAPRAKTMDEIRKTFISALKKYHPDKHYQSGPEALDLAESRTKEILAAYKEIQKACRSED